MNKLGIGALSLALIMFAAGRAGGGKPRPRRRRPDAADDGVPVVNPRTPTLSGGAAAMIDG